MRAEDYLAGHPAAVAVYDRLCGVLRDLGPVEIRASKSQIAFRRRRGFAYLWLPGQYLRKPAAELVISFALGRHDASPRFKEVVHPSPTHWMHHLEVDGPDDIDDEVVAWLAEAAERAATGQA